MVFHVSHQVVAIGGNGRLIVRNLKTVVAAIAIPWLELEKPTKGAQGKSGVGDKLLNLITDSLVVPLI